MGEKRKGKRGREREKKTLKSIHRRRLIEIFKTLTASTYSAITLPMKQGVGLFRFKQS